MSGSVIIAWYASQFADLHAPLARIMKARHDIDTVLCCYRESTLPNSSRYDFDKGAFREIVTVEDLLYPRPESQIGTATDFADDATLLETSLSMSLTDILRCDRHLGIEFVTGADFYRSHFGTALSFRQKLDIAARLARHFGDLLNRHEVLAVMVTPGDVGGAALVAAAEGRGVPLQQFVRARSGRRFYLTRDRHCWPLGLEPLYADKLVTLPPDVAALPLEMPQAAKIYFSGLTARATPRFLWDQIRKACRREAGRLLKRREVINREYLLQDRLAIAWDRWLHHRSMLRDSAVFPGLPPDQPYVFFPLTVEPESSLMAESQMCDNQLSFIDWVAKSLPSGWLLLVKEHPAATAPRPKGFWERIRKYPNTIVLAALEPGETIAAGARAVATINGSLGVQAATEGVPLITCHPRYVGGLLPHAFTCRRYEDVATALQSIRREDLPPVAARKRAAAALLAALDDLCYPLEDRNLLRGVAGGEKIAIGQLTIMADAYVEALSDVRRRSMSFLEVSNCTKP